MPQGAQEPQPNPVDKLIVEGTVTRNVSYGFLEVEADGVTVLATISGQMQRPGRPKIRVVPGEVVRVELPPYEATRGRIIWRYS